MKDKMQDCLNWSKCSVPLCPFDVERDKRVAYDDEEKCTMSENMLDVHRNNVIKKTLEFKSGFKSKFKLKLRM